MLTRTCDKDWLYIFNHDYLDDDNWVGFKFLSMYNKQKIDPNSTRVN